MEITMSLTENELWVETNSHNLIVRCHREEYANVVEDCVNNQLFTSTSLEESLLILNDILDNVGISIEKEELKQMICLHWNLKAY